MTIPRLACLALMGFLFGQTHQSPAVCKYSIKTSTGARPNATTNAIVYIVIYGSDGHCLKLLYTQGNTLSGINIFIVQCPCMGSLLKLKIWHTNTGIGPSWYLKYVGVQKLPLLPAPARYQTFPCNKWLSSTTSLKRQLTASKTPYRIKIYTGSQANAGTNAQVRILLQSNTTSIRAALTGGFPSGSARTFFMKPPSISPLTQVSIKYNNAGSGPGWYVKRIYVNNLAMKIVYKCLCNCWIRSPNLYKAVTCNEI